MKVTQHFLIIDDEPEQLDILSENLLEVFPDDVIYRANNVAMALRIMNKKPVDLVISDWAMPEQDGLDLIARVGQHAFKKWIPIIIVSGAFTRVDSLKQALDKGAFDYIKKPLDKIELVARVQSALKFAEVQQALLHSNQHQKKTFEFITDQLFESLEQAHFVHELLRVTHQKDPRQFQMYLNKALERSVQAKYLLSELAEWSSLRFAEKLEKKPFYLGQFLKGLGAQYPLFEHVQIRSERMIHNDQALLTRFFLKLLDCITTLWLGKETEVQIQSDRDSCKVFFRFYCDKPIEKTAIAMNILTEMATLLDIGFTLEDIPAQGTKITLGL